MRQILLLTLLLSLSGISLAQTVSKSGFWRPDPRNYSVTKAIEIEAVPFVYFSEGYHLSIGYRYKKFRFRASIIDAGTFNSETKDDRFERFETKGTFGFFVGYYVWKNLEAYGFTDRQVFDIRQKSTSEIKQINSTSPGVGIGYQFFIGRYFYIQPALHLYVRGNNEVKFSDNAKYAISKADLTPVVRLGIRPWKKF